MHLRAISLLFLICITLPALAQGTGGLLPDPISTRNLAAWFERLDTTADQRTAILALHDEYLTQCRRLRDTRIQQLLDRDREVYATSQPGLLIARDDLADFLRDRDAIAGSLAALDANLFTNIAALFGESAQPILESMRFERECNRLIANKFLTPWLSRLSSEGWEEVVIRAELSQDEIAVVQIHLDAHYRALAPILRRLTETVNRQLVSYIENLAERGFARRAGVPAMEDPVEREPMLAAWWEEIASTRDQVRDVARARVEAAAEIARELSPPAATRFRTFLPYFIRGMVLDSTLTRASEHFEELLKRSDLSEDQRGAIQDAYAQWSANWGAILDQSARDSVEDTAGATMWSGEPMHSPEWQANVRERGERQRAQLESINAAAIETLKSIVGPNEVESVAAALKARSDAQRQERRENPDTILEMVNIDNGAMTFLPPQVTRADVDRLIQFGELDEATTEQVRETHDLYFTALREFTATGFDAVRAEPVVIRIDEAAPHGRAPTVEELARGEQARDDVIERLRNVEAKFLSDLQSIVGNDDALALMRMHRDYRAYGDYLGWWMEHTYRGYSERTANLVEVVEDADISAQSRTYAREFLFQRADSISAALRAQYEAHMSHQHEEWNQYRGWEEIRASAGTSAEQAAMWDASGLKESRGAAVDSLQAARTALIDLNRRIVEEITAAIGEHSRTDAEMLRRAYRRNAYPGVYADPDFAGPILERALSLDGLTEPQTRALIAILFDLENDYETHSIEICAVFSDSESQAIQSGEEEDWRDTAIRQEKIDAIKFYRREVSDRARLALREVLTEEQWKRAQTM